ncbi:hypothetical protein GIB67_018835 [Kingdonia uniflora]|uniref:Uncharacterized protein n=1 Tax=Kingdonia uniflora TaxID=39325 RepID=A0A7J7NDT7_9MAGN|nr:hypothetical protein GIB67_018835 [Kingdonia uniflora]
MKREGRQHGMVRTYTILPPSLNPNPNKKIINEIDALAITGLFTKVTSKPTNHSKFTGKCGRSRCGECHVHPASKSKDKAKGAQKLKVWDGRTNYGGVSATTILRHMSRDYHDYNYEEEEEEEIEYRGPRGIEKIEEDDVVVDEDCTSFCEVGFVVDQVDGDDEGWCLVGEL